LHTERALTNSLKTKHYFQPSLEERVLTTKDIACQNMIPILVKMGSWKTIVSLFNVNKTMYSYLDERNKDGLALKDEIKSKMFAYRELDSKIMAKYYREEDNLFTGGKCFVRGGKTLGEQNRCSFYVICANCDEALSITADTWIFIKETRTVVSSHGRWLGFQISYYFQRNKNGAFEDGYWYITEACKCLDDASLIHEPD